MALADLNERERDIVRQCLRAAADGPFFPEWEFSIIFGLTREQVGKTLAAWPDLDETNTDVVRAINNSMNNLLGYPIKRENMEAWPDFISVDRLALVSIFAKWKGKSTEERYVPRCHFENMM